MDHEKVGPTLNVTCTNAAAEFMVAPQIAQTCQEDKRYNETLQLTIPQKPSYLLCVFIARLVQRHVS